jgi:hypothetical protein
MRGRMSYALGVGVYRSWLASLRSSMSTLFERIQRSAVRDMRINQTALSSSMGEVRRVPSISDDELYTQIGSFGYLVAEQPTR